MCIRETLSEEVSFSAGLAVVRGDNWDARMVVEPGRRCGGKQASEKWLIQMLWTTINPLGEMHKINDVDGVGWLPCRVAIFERARVLKDVALSLHADGSPSGIDSWLISHGLIALLLVVHKFVTVRCGSDDLMRH